jgi:hypothetical protein
MRIFGWRAERIGCSCIIMPIAHVLRPPPDASLEIAMLNLNALIQMEHSSHANTLFRLVEARARALVRECACVSACCACARVCSCVVHRPRPTPAAVQAGGGSSAPLMLLALDVDDASRHVLCDRPRPLLTRARHAARGVPCCVGYHHAAVGYHVCVSNECVGVNRQGLAVDFV